MSTMFGFRFRGPWLYCFMIAVGLILPVFGKLAAQGDEVRDFDRDRARIILRNIQREIEKHHYDPDFHGIDLEKRFAQAQAQLDQARTLGQLFGFVASAVLDLKDSHTWFLPPPRTVRVEYGWRVQAFGDACRVTAVKPGSDAEAKGLRPGDRILAVNGFALARENLRLFQYRYYILQPETSLRLLVEDAAGRQREIEVAGEVETQKRQLDLADSDGIDFWELVRDAQNGSWEHETVSLDCDGCEKTVLYWRMPSFTGDVQDIQRLFHRVRKHDALILDLRGNGGGRVDLLSRFLGYLFDHDVEVARLEGRKPQKPIVAESHGDQVFGGDLVVLVDSQSASAAELAARILQLEERGTVLGDRTAGAVLLSRTHSLTLGRERRVVPYAIQVSEADVVMPDGNRLEGSGVVPDELLLPTAEDLAADRDPVLARAAEKLGGSLDPAQAGELTRFEWDD